jgi:hypothetical protein
LLVNNPPDDLLYEVKNTFDNFFDKCVYYFKSQEHNTILENHSNDNDNVENDDFEKESKNIENGDYIEVDNNDNDNDNDDNHYDNVNTTISKKNTSEESPVYATNKYHKHSIKANSGVENIQQLPINWFHAIKQNSKK